MSRTSVHRGDVRLKPRPISDNTGHTKMCGTCEYWKPSGRKGDYKRSGECRYTLPACVREYESTMWDDEGQDCEVWYPK
jgi:MoaA/NifB/PqqE/SkfB family radical SAM enzyme